MSYSLYGLFPSIDYKTTTNLLQTYDKCAVLDGDYYENQRQRQHHD